MSLPNLYRYPALLRDDPMLIGRCYRFVIAGSALRGWTHRLRICFTLDCLKVRYGEQLTQSLEEGAEGHVLGKRLHEVGLACCFVRVQGIC